MTSASSIPKPQSSISNPSSATLHSRIIIGGTIAIDHVKTPEAEANDLLGGSAAYAALAASFFSQPVDLVGIIGHDFPQAHLDMLVSRGVTLTGVERSENESFTWSGEYHANMNERTTHRVGLNVLESWQVSIPAEIAAAEIVVLANMSPDNQLQMLAECGVGGEGLKIGDRGSEMKEEEPCASGTCSIPNAQSTTHDPSSRFVIADTMDLWISIANERLHEVLPHLDLFVLNEGEARDLAGTTNLVKAGRILLEKGPRHVAIKLGEFGAMLFSKTQDAKTQDARLEDVNGESLAASSAIADPQSTISAPSSSPALFRCSAYPLEAVADPTGAGDTFLGGIAGYLAAHGAPPYDLSVLRQAVVQGSILASFTCEAFSTRRLESLTQGELEARIEHFRATCAW